MKIKIFSVVLLTILFVAVTINTVFLTRRIDQIITDVNSISTENTTEATERSKEIFDKHKKSEGFLSLTISHNDLADINGYFTEMIAYLSIENAEEAGVAKSRLIDALTQIKRLSGWNIQAVF